jgi:hypothetical protein
MPQLLREEHQLLGAETDTPPPVTDFVQLRFRERLAQKEREEEWFEFVAAVVLSQAVQRILSHTSK